MTSCSPALVIAKCTLMPSWTIHVSPRLRTSSSSDRGISLPRGSSRVKAIRPSSSSSYIARTAIARRSQAGFSGNSVFARHHATTPPRHHATTPRIPRSHGRMRQEATHVDRSGSTSSPLTEERGVVDRSTAGSNSGLNRWTFRGRGSSSERWTERPGRSQPPRQGEGRGFESVFRSTLPGRRRFSSQTSASARFHCVRPRSRPSVEFACGRTFP
jgi:hypothetical protein